MQMLSAPSVAFEACWADADALFRGVQDWGRVPISVRHPFCFYYAHLAAFTRLKLFPQVPSGPRSRPGGVTENLLVIRDAHLCAPPLSGSTTPTWPPSPA